MNARSALVLFAALAALRHSVWCRKTSETVEKNYAINRPAFGAHFGVCWCGKVMASCGGVCDAMLLIERRSLEQSCEASIATWLILPVVIRSSQRLSHACVSINDFIL